MCLQLTSPQAFASLADISNKAYNLNLTLEGSTVPPTLDQIQRALAVSKELRHRHTGSNMDRTDQSITL